MLLIRPMISFLLRVIGKLYPVRWLLGFLFGILICVTQPKSRGSLSFGGSSSSSSHRCGEMKIDPNYLSHPQDIETLHNAFRTAQRIVADACQEKRSGSSTVHTSHPPPPPSSASSSSSPTHSLGCDMTSPNRKQSQGPPPPPPPLPGDEIEPHSRDEGNGRRASPKEPLRCVEVLPGPLFSYATSAHSFQAYASFFVNTYFHGCGTCCMPSNSTGTSTGTSPSPSSEDEDDNSVVTSDLKVKHIRGLRVADASVIPSIPSAPIHAVCMAIGTACANLIRRENETTTNTTTSSMSSNRNSPQDQ